MRMILMMMKDLSMAMNKIQDIILQSLNTLVLIEVLQNSTLKACWAYKKVRRL